MINALKSKIHRLLKRESGTFTLEASLTFPVILLILLAFIFFSIFVYQKGLLYYQASYISEKLAHVWDSNSKLITDGSFKPVDPVDITFADLYWRVLYDSDFEVDLSTEGGTLHLIEPDLGLFKADGRSVEKVNGYVNQSNSPEGFAIENDSLFPVGMSGSVRYDNSLIERKITVELQAPLKLPFVGRYLSEKNSLIQASSSVTVTDPVEFMRNIDLVRTYFTQIIKNEGIISELSNYLNSSK